VLDSDDREKEGGGGRKKRSFESAAKGNEEGVQRCKQWQRQKDLKKYSEVRAGVDLQRRCQKEGRNYWARRGKNPGLTGEF